MTRQSAVPKGPIVRLIGTPGLPSTADTFKLLGIVTLDVGAQRDYLDPRYPGMTDPLMPPNETQSPIDREPADLYFINLSGIESPLAYYVDALRYQTPLIISEYLDQPAPLPVNWLSDLVSFDHGPIFGQLQLGRSMREDAEACRIMLLRVLSRRSLAIAADLDPLGQWKPAEIMEGVRYIEERLPLSLFKIPDTTVPFSVEELRKRRANPPLPGSDS